MNKLETMARNIRKWSLIAIHAAQSGHPGGSLSCADILAALYGDIMDPQDVFVLSKGHAAPALYAALAEDGVLDHDALYDFRKIDSLLQGHPYIKCPGVETSTGSLGQGLSVAAGMAWGLQYIESEAKVYVIVGDGELQEGICWEAMAFAAQHKLNNLIIFLDYNGYQSDRPVDEVIQFEPIKLKLADWGMHVLESHNPSASDLTHLYNSSWQNVDKPLVVIVHTIKGRGVAFMEEAPEQWHGSVAMSNAQLRKALESLEEG